jgi:hypothetical protein
MMNMRNHTASLLLVLLGALAATSAFAEANKAGAGQSGNNSSVITGTGISRPGSGPASVGGAPKSTTGINGTNTKPKH